MCHLSPVTCQVSSVTCHVSPVTCHLSHVITRTPQQQTILFVTPQQCTVGWTKNIRKPNFFGKPKKSSKTRKLKNVKRYANISDIPFDQRSLIHREAWFPPCFVRQNLRF